MASVKPNYNKDGKIISYRFRACVGRDETTGRQEFVTKTVSPPAGLTPAKALKRMQTDANVWEKEIKKGNAPIKQDSFRYYINEQFIPLFVCNGKHSPSTIKFYKDKCKRLVERFGNKKLDNISSLDIDRFLVDLSKETYKRGKKGEEHQYSAAFVRHHRTVLTSAFNYAELHRMIEHNPMQHTTPIKADRIEVDFLPAQEAKQFLSCLEEYASLYWKTAMNLLIRCGLRRGELAGLKWMDLDEDNFTINVCRDVINNEETGWKNYVKDTKSTNSDRTLPLDTVMMKLLTAWKTEQSELYGATLMPTAYIFGRVLPLRNKKVIPREELYEKVWSKPVSEVAKEYEISDNALRKRCIQLDVPIPKRGYWAKIKAGQNIEKPVLPEKEFESDNADPYTPIRPDSITQWLDRFCKKHGVDYKFHKVSPHDLRHTLGTLWSQNKVPVKDIQNMLGHSDPSTTLKYYCGSNIDTLKTASYTLSQVLLIDSEKSAI
jgi:integrase